MNLKNLNLNFQFLLDILRQCSKLILQFFRVFKAFLISFILLIPVETMTSFF